MLFSVTGAHVGVVLFYFVYAFIGAGARGWVVDTAGHGGGYILQGLGCWLTVELFWAPDLHLQRMFLTINNEGVHATGSPRVSCNLSYLQ